MFESLARPIWKERTCMSCGCVYRGRIPLPKTEEAVATAVRTGRDLTALLSSANSTAATIPCPGCGVRPHYVVAAWRAGFHVAVVVATIAATIALGVVAVNRTLTGDAFYFAAASTAAAVALLHLVAWHWNPNRNRAAQQRLGDSASDDGRLIVMRDSTREPGPGAYPRWPHLAIPCALVAAAAPLSTVLFLGVEKPPKIVQTVQVKEMVKAGDRDVVASWDGGFKSVSGLYKTLKGNVALKNATALGLPPAVEYHLHQDSWSGDTIDDQGDSQGRIQVRLVIPNDPKVKGKTLDYRVEIEVEYPVRISSTQFLEAKASYTHDFSIRVATDDEVAKANNFGKASVGVAISGVAGLLAGLVVVLAAVGAWNPTDDGRPVAD